MLTWLGKTESCTKIEKKKAKFRVSSTPVLLQGKKKKKKKQLAYRYPSKLSKFTLHLGLVFRHADAIIRCNLLYPSISGCYLGENAPRTRAAPPRFDYH